MPFKPLFLFVVFSASMTLPALAYVGPGAGLSAIGTLLAIVFAALLAVVGFVWYPLKRLLGLSKKPAAQPQETEAENQEQSQA